MAHFLIKSDPDTYGLADLEKDGSTVWDGVRNPFAVKHMRTVASGDHVLVYHTGSEKAVVGLAVAASAGRDDPKNKRLAVFDLRFVARAPKPLTLAAVKADPVTEDCILARASRLSVMPLDPPLFAHLCKGAGLKVPR